MTASSVAATGRRSRSPTELALRLIASAALCLLLAGCLSYDRDAANAVAAIGRGDAATALKWSTELTDSSRSSRLGVVETGRICMLAGSNTLAEACFRKAIDAAIDHQEKDPVIKLGDAAGTAMAATVTDDWSIEYYLSPYEINLALEYGILAQLFNGRREDALVDSRLAIYVQDKLGDEYGADLKKREETGGKGDAEKTKGEVERISGEQNQALNEMIAATRNSWENPVLWWLTGVLLEADGDWEGAGQSYRRAGTTGAGNPFFEADMRRADTGAPAPIAGRSKLVVIFEDGFVPRRAALKIPLRLYATMSIDIPTYQNVGAYAPRTVSFAGSKGATPAALGLNIRSLAGRTLSEEMPGIITRNVTRAAVNVGISIGGRAAAANRDWGAVVWLCAEIVNLCMVCSRDADTRTWVTLPEAQYVWCDGDLAPGDYQFGVTVDGVSSTVPVSLAAGETTLLWISDCGGGLRHQCAIIGRR